uniref:BTB domain-containing protein n=1 Tax=Moniliophthora roreri TaxID=221103 RepID=A0A0W0FQT4_MONRR
MSTSPSTSPVPSSSHQLFPPPRLPIAVSEPFNDPKADIVLRTTDNAEFRVYRSILSLSSPFFMDMFSLPQPPKGEKADAKAPSTSDQVLPVDENSLILDRVLRYMYPSCEPPLWSDLQEIIPVIQVMTKYQMEQSMPFKRIIESLLARPIELQGAGMSPAPGLTLGVLGILYLFKESLSHEWLERAAKLVLRIPLKALIESRQCPQLEYMSARAYLDLLDYHKKCSEAIRSRPLPTWADASDLVYECTNGAMTDGVKPPTSTMMNSDTPRNGFNHLRGVYKEHPYACAEWSSVAPLVTGGFCQSCPVCQKNPCASRVKAMYRLFKIEVEAAISTIPVPL